jgi:hypothetical protein
MSETFTLPSGHIVAETSVDANDFYGVGRSEFPILSVRVQLSFQGPREAGCCFHFRELHCKISAFETDFLGVALPTPIRIRLEAEKQLPAHPIFLEFPLDHARLALINRLRNGGNVEI